MFNKVSYFNFFLFFAFLAAALQSIDCRAMNVQEGPEISGTAAEMVWVRQEEAANRVYYSSLQNDVWSKPVQLSHDRQANLVPTIASDSSNRTFVVWSVVAKGSSFLNFVILRDGVIENGPLKIETELSTNMAPFLAEDHDGVLWLVWSGNNGTTSDIYYSYWENNRWQSPERVHAENSVPDILPQLKVDFDGTVSVSWTTYGPDGYTVMTRKLKNGTGPAASGPPGEKEIFGNPLACVKTFPVDESILDKAVLLSRCQNDVLPVQIRFGGKAGESRDYPR